MTRKTPQKQLLRELFKEEGRPLSAQEARELAQNKMPKISLATVYRIIREGVASGWIKAVELPGDAARYEWADLPHHHFFHCRHCERVYDLPGCPQGIRQMVPKGFSADAHELVFYGCCEACA
jgi:Fur family ferric uptake transcriptional regulator